MHNKFLLHVKCFMATGFHKHITIASDKQLISPKQCVVYAGLTDTKSVVLG